MFNSTFFWFWIVLDFVILGFSKSFEAVSVVAGGRDIRCPNIECEPYDLGELKSESTFTTS